MNHHLQILQSYTSPTQLSSLSAIFSSSLEFSNLLLHSSMSYATTTPSATANSESGREQWGQMVLQHHEGRQQLPGSSAPSNSQILDIMKVFDAIYREQAANDLTQDEATPTDVSLPAEQRSTSGP